MEKTIADLKPGESGLIERARVVEAWQNCYVHPTTPLVAPGDGVGTVAIMCRENGNLILLGYTMRFDDMVMPDKYPVPDGLEKVELR